MHRDGCGMSLAAQLLESALKYVMEYEHKPTVIKHVMTGVIYWLHNIYNKF